MTSPGWSMRPRPAKPFISRVALGIVGGALWLIGFIAQFDDWRRIGIYLGTSALLLALRRIRY